MNLVNWAGAAKDRFAGIAELEHLSLGAAWVLYFCFSFSLENTLIYFCDKPVTTGGLHC